MEHAASTTELAHVLKILWACVCDECSRSEVERVISQATSDDIHAASPVLTQWLVAKSFLFPPVKLILKYDEGEGSTS